MSNQISHVTVIADYGNGDPAFIEVSQRLLVEFPQAQIQTLSVPAFDTLSTGFWVAQYGLNPGPTGRLIYHNCAPRKDDSKARLDNEGEGLTFALLPNDVKVVGVHAGYTLSFIKEYAQVLHTVKASHRGSQFRSRDVFPQAAAALALGDYSLLGEHISLSQIPDVPQGQIAWIDGYGNIKTTIPADTTDLSPGSKVAIQIGGVVSEAVYADGSFTVPEGVLAFAPGSSGWAKPDGKRQLRWMELFLRGGSAWEQFGKPKIGKPITQIRTWSTDDEEEWVFLSASI